MESSQEQSCYTLQVMSENRDALNVTGGITSEITTSKIGCYQLIETDIIRVFEDLILKRDLKMSGSIIPLNDYGNSYVGTLDKKINTVNTINVNSAHINTKNVNTKNLDFTYFYPKITNYKLEITQDTSYNLVLDSSYINIDISFNTVGLNLDIYIPKPFMSTSNNFVRINMTSNVCGNVNWNVNDKNYTFSDCNLQILELYNTSTQWVLINLTNYNFESKINNLEISNNLIDLSLNDLNTKVEFLTETNNFLNINNGENTYNIMEFVDKNDELKTEIDNLGSNLETLDNKVENERLKLASLETNFNDFKTNQELINSSNTLNIEGTNNTIIQFKKITNDSFQLVNNHLVKTDADIAELKQWDKVTELEIKKIKDNIDYLDKKLSNHISSTNKKITSINDTLRNMETKVNYLYNSC